MAVKPRRGYEAFAVVKCVNCDATKTIVSNEVNPEDYPMCDKCFLPMLPEMAGVRKKE